MPKRGVRLRVVAAGAAALVGLVVVAVGVFTWITRTSGPSVWVTSEEGGVSVAVPRNWSVELRHPTDPDHQEFLNGREKAALGVLQRGGFWVARWAATADATTETIKARMRAEQAEKRRGKWSVGDAELAGYPAVVMRYAEPPKSMERLRLGDVKTVVRELIANGYVFQVGTWTLPHAGDVPRKLEEIAESLRIFDPKPWIVELEDSPATFTLPSGWVERVSDQKAAVFHALAPGDPTQAWAYVFRFNWSPAASLRDARRNITNNGGTITGERNDKLGGRKAVRLDFTFPDGEFGDARDVEWFVSDGKGGTFVLAVGRRSGDEDIAEQISATWRFG